MKITERVYSLDSTKGAFAYLILGEEMMLIDTGFSWKGNRLVKELEAMNLPLKEIRHVLLTHYDLDHIGNAARLARLTGAELWASETDRSYILGDKDRPGFKKYLARISKNEKPLNINPLPQSGMFHEIRIIPTPGHTPGHVCFLYDDVLFAGDLVENPKGEFRPYPSFWNWNTPLLKNSIEEVAKYSFQWICPAHGKPAKESSLPIR